MKCLPAIALSLLCSWLGAASVTLLDGTRIEGETPAFSGENGELGGTTFSLAEVDWFAPSDAKPGVLMGDLGATLADGSWIPLTRVTGGTEDAITVEGPLGELTLPLGVVVGWGSGAWLDSHVNRERDEILLRRDRAGAETWRGQVLGISDNALLLQTELQEEPLQLPLKNIMGVRLGMELGKPEGLYFRGRFAENRPVCAFASTWPPALAVDPSITLPAKALPRLRLFGGRRVSLADLEPQSVIEEGAFGVVWPHKRHVNLDGSPLYLEGKRVDTALVLHSRATLSWKLDGKYERLRTRIGISDLVKDVGDCAVTISVDKKVRWERKSVTGEQGGLPVEVDLTDAKELEILVDFGEKYDIGDHLVLADPFLLRRP